MKERRVFTSPQNNQMLNIALHFAISGVYLHCEYMCLFVFSSIFSFSAFTLFLGIVLFALVFFFLAIIFKCKCQRNTQSPLKRPKITFVRPKIPTIPVHIVGISGRYKFIYRYTIGCISHMNEKYHTQW